MKFNNGSERVRLENRWKKLRIQYREAGMSEDAIQAMYQSIWMFSIVNVPMLIILSRFL